MVDYSERAINDDNLEDQLLNIERERLLAQKIELISPECRQMLVWIFENKKTAFEIAQVLGTKEGNVRKKKYDCKQRLFKLIQEDPLYKELIWSNE
ncbi:MAG: sigma-70 family RNA polymerase sigma factor [Saprospiraceae bacterium]|nr:sigma-70 family RNA polymerase sigma factor [Saprospiraceae bacterium]